MRWLLVAVLWAGCADPSLAGEQARLVAGDAPDDPWLLHTTGCGFCGGEDHAWADTLVLGRDGDVLWFSFRPPSGFEGADQWQGIDIPAEHEHLRAAIEAAAAILISDDVYWTRDGDIRIYDARTFAVEDWPPMRIRLDGLAEGLQDPPQIRDHGCQDCAMPVVHVVQHGVVGGAIQERGSLGPGTGNVGRGTAWDVLEENLHGMHLQAAA